MGRYVDLTGQTFGRLTVMRRDEDHVSKSGRHEVTYRCKCSCGNECVVMKVALVKGFTKSCGCLKTELAKQRMTKRDDISRRLRIVHRNMLNRCYDPSDRRYDRYGGRGIKVCDEWRGEDGQENFIAWARENGYADGLTIDRKENDGDYCPENCHWVTVKEQCNNRSTNTVVTVDGMTKTIAQWREYLGIKSTGLYYYDEQKKIDFIRQKLRERS